MATQTPSISLDRMLLQVGLLGDYDDWTGSMSSVKRRKLQNRINQRAHRKRKREEAKSASAAFTESNSASTNDFGTVTKPGSLPQHERANTDACVSLEGLWRLFYSAVGSQQIDRSNLERVGKLCKANGVESESNIAAFQQWVKCQNAVSSPRTDSLLVLVKFNIVRALLSNGIMLGFSTAGQYLDADALSPFFERIRPEGPHPSVSSLPPALRPTKFQCQIPHHPWLDLFPDPVMRDNLIRAGDAYDKDQLCLDMVGLFSASTGRNGLIIWGEPWDPTGWEVTKPFLKHWGWALRGCEELLRATNYWRQKRGDPSLKFEGLTGN